MTDTGSQRFRPLGMTYYVRQMSAPEKSKGGIFLPQGTPLEATEAEVICQGTGREKAEHEWRYRFQARVGERVLFERIDLAPVGDEGEGVLGDEDLIGIRIADPPGIQPCNEWLLLRLAERVRKTAGGLHVPDRYQKRSDHGVVLDYGPGRLRCSGPLAGTRATCGELLDTASFGDVRGLTLYWKRDARLMEVLGGEPNLMLVRAADVVAMAETQKGGDDGKESYGGSEAVPSQSCGV